MGSHRPTPNDARAEPTTLGKQGAASAQRKIEPWSPAQVATVIDALPQPLPRGRRRTRLLTSR